MTGIDFIAEERQRQIDEEGWTINHDVRHRTGQLVEAAIAYAAQSINIEVRRVTIGTLRHIYSDLWPWDKTFDKRKKHAPLRCLVIAGALLAAEIDRRIQQGEGQ